MNDCYVKSKRAASDTDDESWKRGGVSPTLNVMDNTGESRATVLTVMGEASHALTSAGGSEDGTGRGTPIIAGTSVQQVRRLTPLECERLQGFPDGWTDEQADSSRYKQMGNAVAVPVVEWILRRLVEVDAR